MAVGFTTWTVLPHKPIQRLGDNLWRVSARMANGVQRCMVVARLDDGRLIVHNPIALDEPSMAELEAWGEVAAIVSPNALHRQDTFIWKQRYPKARLYAPRGARKAVDKASPTDGDLDEVPRDDRVRCEHLAGTRDREGVLVVHSDTGCSITFCDCLFNLPPASGIRGFVFAPTGVPAMPRVAWWILASKPATLREHLNRLADEGPVRLIPGHGGVVTEDAAAVLRQVAAGV